MTYIKNVIKSSVSTGVIMAAGVVGYLAGLSLWKGGLETKVNKGVQKLFKKNKMGS